MKKNKHFSKRNSAFSLVELLVVMAIITVMAGVGMAVFRGGTASSGGREASTIAYSLFNAARTEAILRQSPARVIVDTVYNSGRPENYLRRISIAALRSREDTTNPAVVLDADGNTDPAIASNWSQIQKWVFLSQGVYYDADYSKPTGTMDITFAGSGAPTSGYDYYEFSANGRASDLQFVVSPGLLVGTQFKVKNEGQLRYGFVVHLLGRMSFFPDVASIPPVL
ncbi:MAG: prepilin-type N-terminal cleavage/methylation domain-containing protein [Candidatus Methylacidiphilales bacterium]|nr:prepilin-type N-terminal cleavage/methylation domain-containing protein [Candidatus Methylacidiphilales bacterium]